MPKQFRQNGPIHRGWALYPVAGGHRFKLLSARTFRFLPAGTSETFGPGTKTYTWTGSAGGSIGADLQTLDVLGTPWVIFTVLGSGAFFAIREDLHDLAVLNDTLGDAADLFWLINGRVEDRQA